MMRIQLGGNRGDGVGSGFLSELLVPFRLAAPPEQFFHRPALEHLPDNGRAAARRIGRKFSGDQQFGK
jgi:hypothetical protein